MNKNIIVIAMMMLTVMAGVFAANTVTLQEPDASETIDKTAAFVLNATLDTNDHPIIYCNFTYKQHNSGAFVSIGNVVNDTVNDTEFTYSWPAASMPQYMSNLTFWVNCSNSTAMVTGDSSASVTIKSYAAADLPEVMIDFVATYWVQLVAFAGLFAIGLALIVINKFGLMTVFLRR